MESNNKISDCHCCQNEIKFKYNAYMLDNWNIELYEKMLYIPEDVIKGVDLKIADISSENIHILLCGAGSGRIEIPILKKIKESISKLFIDVVDINNKFIERFKEKIKSDFSQDEFIFHNVLLEEFFNQHKVENRYNLVTAFFILYLIPNWKEVVIKILKNMDEKGVFILAEEIGDFKEINITESDDKQNEYRKYYKEFWDEIKKSGFVPLYNYHSYSDLGLLGDIFEILNEGGLVELNKIESTWDNNKIKFSELLESLKGNELVISMNATHPKEIRKNIYNTFKEKWDKILDEYIPRKEGHRFWIIKMKEQPDIIADKFNKIYCSLLAESRVYNSQFIDLIKNYEVLKI